MAFGYNPNYPYNPAPYGQPNYVQPQQPVQAYAPPQPMRQDYPTPAPQAQPGAISARYVTGREEAVAAQIIPDGNIWIFADFAHNKIYTKQVNPQSGIADFREYAATQPTVQPEPVAAPAPQYVTVEQFNALSQRVDELRTASAAPVNAGTKRSSKGGADE